MATYTDRSTVQEMVDNNGVYKEDDPPLAIYEYQNVLSGKTAWCVILDPADEPEMWRSPFVRNPKLIWAPDKGKIQDPGGDEG